MQKSASTWQLGTVLLILLVMFLIALTGGCSPPNVTVSSEPPLQIATETNPALRLLQSPTSLGVATTSPEPVWTILPFGKLGIGPVQPPIIVTSRPEADFTPTPGATLYVTLPPHPAPPLATHDPRTPIPTLSGPTVPPSIPKTVAPPPVTVVPYVSPTIVSPTLVVSAEPTNPFGRAGTVPAQPPIIVTGNPEANFTPTPGATLYVDPPRNPAPPWPTNDLRTPLPTDAPPEIAPSTIRTLPPPPVTIIPYISATATVTPAGTILVTPAAGTPTP